jgi:hypothetical protein
VGYVAWAASVSGPDIDMWATNDPGGGIVATPVIDPQKNYVVGGRLA